MVSSHFFHSMFSFIFSHILSLKIRSLSIIFAVIIFSFLLALFLVLYSNILSALQYYGPTHIDATRVTFVSQVSIFDMFARDGWGIDSALLMKIKSDSIFSRTRSFSFVDTNTIWWFDIFSFHLDTDIPVFTLDDSRWDIGWFGISPSMIHYYNIELAGSHPMFPTLDEHFLEGKKISLTFGASKIFQVWGVPSTPLRWSIVSIDSDYPGFGIVGSRTEIEKKLAEIGIIPRQPYKIVAYMKNQNSRSEIEDRYRTFLPKFDSDLIAERQKQFRALFLTLLVIGSIFWGIILILISLLFLGYFREKAPLFRLAHVYGIAFPSRQILLFAESGIFILLGIIGSFLFISSLQASLFPFLSRFLQNHGVLFPLLRLSFMDIVSLLLFTISLLLLIIFIVSRKNKSF